MKTIAGPATGAMVISFFSPVVPKSVFSHERISVRPTDVLEALSHAEFAVLAGLANGMRSISVARALGINQSTVCEYKTRIRHKFGLASMRSLNHWLRQSSALLKIA